MGTLQIANPSPPVSYSQTPPKITHPSLQIIDFISPSIKKKRERELIPKKNYLLGFEFNCL